MGKLRAIIPILLALIVAGGASLLLYRWLQSRTAPQAVVKVVESEAVPMAVAAADLPWGSVIKPEMVKMVPFLKESLPPGHFTTLEDIKGRVLIAQVKKGEPILESRLAPKSITSGGVSAVVSPGKRALAVKGDKVIGISGFIRPGNKVDVLVTMTDPKSELDVTKVVLEHIPVLAAGTEIEGDGKESHPVDVYTLEVTPEEGEKLALAAAQGKLQFALRKQTDGDTVLTRGATISETLASFKHVDPAPPKSNGKAKPVRRVRQSFTVEVIKGGNVSKSEF
jgi:pilus assembly protein CpaB